ncbi:ACT domain protein [Phycisphaerae bacterium RAS2]|nr:ACT domain protein [Phycisphaerae bacterium RAS2]
MNVTVRRATLWSTEKPNTPGTLASALGPLADHGVDLGLVMGYSTQDKSRASVEVSPVDGAAAKRAARQAGFTSSGYPCVSVMGANKPGLGRHIAASLADAGININFFVAQVVGKQYAGMFSFEAESEADLAVKIIRQALAHFSGRRSLKKATASSRAASSGGSSRSRSKRSRTAGRGR